MKALKPPYRLKLLYALSAIVRLSVQLRGSHDKYGERRRSPPEGRRPRPSAHPAPGRACPAPDPSPIPAYYLNPCLPRRAQSAG